MKLVHVTFQIQYVDAVEAILERRGLGSWVRSGRIGGRDRDGRHDGSQAFPGNVTVIRALIRDEEVEGLLEELERFREDKSSHRHLVAAVLPVDRSIGLGEQDGDGGGGEP